MSNITFDPVSITKKLLGGLGSKPRYVLEERFGLTSASTRTLESIGREYGITRERVRQIESFAINKVRCAEELSLFADNFNELKNYIDANGHLTQEENLLSSLFKNEKERKHAYFLLVLGEGFENIKGCSNFHSAWTTDLEKAGEIRKAFDGFHNEIKNEILFSEKDVLDILKRYLAKVMGDKIDKDVLLSLIKVSRVVGSNVLGEWGLSSSPYIRPRGMRDYAFLVMRKHGSPMHFSETAKSIGEIFNKPAHIQTVHNELIKGEHFVLVGRGLYALKDWGYEGGIVRNVIESILSNHGGISKEEIVKRVLKERYVKENTILVNLQNKKYFKKDSRGNYALL
ncbi:hypothetical protein KKA27_02295 [Patescibacteria group bacterium]|nr:hypothetical protein [Patescibacteria group bacterium]MBU2633046.1 hypothetical protein [Patescibacteria group bacterium]